MSDAGLWVPGQGTTLRSEMAAARESELRPLVDIGLFATGTGFTYRCPICGKTERNDQRMEPVCTGPSPSRDEHPYEPMLLVE